MPRTASTYRVLIRQVAGAISMNGTSQYIDLGNAGPISTNTGSFTLSAWFRRTLYPGVVAVVGDRGSGAIKIFTMNFNSTNRCTDSVTTTGGGPALTILPPYPIYQWTNQIIRYDGATASVLRNAQSDVSVARTGTVTAPTGNMSIGSGNGGIRFWGGLIAEVRFWSRALSDAECTQVYQGVNTTALRSGMVGEWNLVSNANDTFGTNNGTPVASPTYSSTDVPFMNRGSVSGRVSVSGRGPIT